MSEEEKLVDYHLQQALIHIDKAINQSVEIVVQKRIAQKEVGQKWEFFLAHFFNTVREKGKENRVNLLSWISFPRLRH